jgi:hypothetical protein
MMKQSNDGSDNWKAFARRKRYHLTDRLEADDERFQLGAHVFWLVLGAACAALGCALFMILTK